MTCDFSYLFLFISYTRLLQSDLLKNFIELAAKPYFQHSGPPVSHPVCTTGGPRLSQNSEACSLHLFLFILAQAKFILPLILTIYFLFIFHLLFLCPCSRMGLSKNMILRIWVQSNHTKLDTHLYEGGSHTSLSFCFPLSLFILFSFSIPTVWPFYR